MKDIINGIYSFQYINLMPNSLVNDFIEVTLHVENIDTPEKSYKHIERFGSYIEQNTVLYDPDISETIGFSFDDLIIKEFFNDYYSMIAETNIISKTDDIINYTSGRNGCWKGSFTPL